ncbi:MAG TPA: ornithine--oxo-acid transaminase [Candidatus Mcinerneyibacteriales bacterium]|jgi:ornithine--oxo-acid transaminase|nr:ornithine--oxo-acid transaminase [Candidatus Mcinerneyibacteriales bacterium]HPJ71012.1 ornithine--oxo-acid transaminase [Candidatus Mcinerneyibacteriales bacterium]HPQ88779.1 ornithine--oxo-acid transaminase [Candidatus Mcinerneyibacteriales bacterium]
MNTKDFINMDHTYGAHNYHPLPVVISEAKGAKVKDPEGKEYFDFLSAYSAVNQGHRHPKIIKALTDQLNRCTLTSRAFHNDMMGPFLKKLCDFTGFEMALPMNTGAEAVETALKLARRWGAEKKGIKNGKQEIIVAENNFHGRTITIVSFSTDPDARVNYGPYTPGFKIVPYNDAKAIEKAITKNTCAVLLEPIQGEAGVFVPDAGYLKAVSDICKKNNVLFIADEIQTGFCRTGKKFAVDHEGVRPDVMTLGKALGGGVIPVSAVVADKHIMEVFTPGSHGSTFGGYPLAMAVGIASIEVLEEENLADKAQELGEFFRSEVKKIKCDKIVQVRGKGLLNAVVFEKGFEAWDVCVALKEAGLLAKQTHGNIIRFAPPLVITKEELTEGLAIIKSVFEKIK